MILSLLTKVDEGFAWVTFSITSRPVMNAFCYSNTSVPDKLDFQKHLYNTFIDSVAVTPLETQNLKQTVVTYFGLWRSNFSRT